VVPDSFDLTIYDFVGGHLFTLKQRRRKENQSIYNFLFCTPEQEEKVPSED
jgi:hypothetical protein